MHMTAISDYLAREALDAIPKAMTNGRMRSAKSPGMAGNQENSTVSPNPANMAVSVPRADIDRPSRRRIRIGPNADPSDDQANNTLEKISARQTNARIVAMIKTTMTVTRLLPRPLSILPSARFQSYEIADAATSNWLSAVDMIADKTAASITPAITGGSSSPATLNITCS